MKKYREKIGPNTIFIASVHQNRKVHDFIKGWGTVSKTGRTILWDEWQKPKKLKIKPKFDKEILFPVNGTSEQRERYLKDFAAFMSGPIMQTIADAPILKDLFSVEPLSSKETFPLTWRGKELG